MPTVLVSMVVGASLLTAAIALAILLRPSIALVAKPAAVDVVQYETASAELQLQRRGWRFGSWAPVGGTFLVRVDDGTHFTIDPAHGDSTASQPNCRFTVTGATEGSGSFIVSATAEGESQASLIRLAVNVLPHPNGDRRIRQTAKSLAAIAVSGKR